MRIAKNRKRTYTVNPDRAKLCAVALRNPADNRRFGLLPRALLYGAVAAVLHYNIFSRILAVINDIFPGFPAANYFDDYGFPLPESLVRMGCRIFRAVCGQAGVIITKKKKTEVSRHLDFLVTMRTSPSPETDIPLQQEMADSKKGKWTSRIGEYIGRINSP